MWRPLACALTLLDVLDKLFGLSLVYGYVQIYCSLCAIAVLRACQKYVLSSKSAEMPFGTIGYKELNYTGETFFADLPVTLR